MLFSKSTGKLSRPIKRSAYLRVHSWERFHLPSKLKPPGPPKKALKMLFASNSTGKKRKLWAEVKQLATAFIVQKPSLRWGPTKHVTNRKLKPTSLLWALTGRKQAFRADLPFRCFWRLNWATSYNYYNWEVCFTGEGRPQMRPSF